MHVLHARSKTTFPSAAAQNRTASAAEHTPWPAPQRWASEAPCWAMEPLHTGLLCGTFPHILEPPWPQCGASLLPLPEEMPPTLCITRLAAQSLPSVESVTAVSWSNKLSAFKTSGSSDCYISHATLSVYCCTLRLGNMSHQIHTEKSDEQSEVFLIAYIPYFFISLIQLMWKKKKQKKTGRCIQNTYVVCFKKQNKKHWLHKKKKERFQLNQLLVKMGHNNDWCFDLMFRSLSQNPSNIFALRAWISTVFQYEFCILVVMQLR